MEGFIVRWAATAAGLFVASILAEIFGLPEVFDLDFPAGSTDFLPGQPVPEWAVILVAGFILAAVNAFIRPLIMMVTCLVNVLTLGLFSIVINIAMIFIASEVMEILLNAGFVDFPGGIFAALVAAVIVGIINAIFDRVF